MYLVIVHILVTSYAMARHPFDAIFVYFAKIKFEHTTTVHNF